MSIALMSAAWKLSIPSGEKMVLLALCDQANEAGECYMLMATIIEKCSMSERTVQGHLASLEKSGLVTRDMRKGRSTIYHIDPRRICATTPAESAPTPANIAGVPPQNLRDTPAESAPTPAESAPITVTYPLQPRSKTNTPVFDALSSLVAAGVDREVASDWIEHRKAKKAKPTRTAIDGIASEAVKAGVDLEFALRECCSRGWVGFKADWMRSDGGNARAGPARQSIHDKRAETIANLTGRTRNERTSHAEHDITGESVRIA